MIAAFSISATMKGTVMQRTIARTVAVEYAQSVLDTVTECDYSVSTMDSTVLADLMFNRQYCAKQELDTLDKCSGLNDRWKHRHATVEAQYIVYRVFYIYLNFRKMETLYTDRSENVMNDTLEHDKIERAFSHLDNAGAIGDARGECAMYYEMEILRVSQELTRSMENVTSRSIGVLLGKLIALVQKYVAIEL